MKPARFFGILWLLVVSGATVCHLPSAASARDPQASNAVSRAREEALRHRLALAKENRLYFVLDPDIGSLTLFHEATPLRVWHVVDAQAGARRLFAGRAESQGHWRAVVWERPRLEPPVRRERRLIVSDQVNTPDPAGAVDWIPPTPEEEVPAPERYIVHFAGGSGLEVVAIRADTLSARSSLIQGLVRSFRGFAPANWDRYRIRIVLSAEEAGMLYRTFPPEAAFVAIIPSSIPW